MDDEHVPEAPAEDAPAVDDDDGPLTEGPVDDPVDDPVEDGEPAGEGGEDAAVAAGDAGNMAAPREGAPVRAEEGSGGRSEEDDFLQSLEGQDIDELRRRRRKAEKEMLRYMDRRNALNADAKRWSNVRDEYNAKVRELLQRASEHKAKRDRINQEVREAKEIRHHYNTLVKDLDHEIRALRKKLLPKDADSLARLKREQRGLEFKQMTQVLSPEKERDLVNALAATQAKIREIERVLEENEEIREKKRQLHEAKAKAEEAHRRVSQLADEAQVEHDAMIELYSQIDELRGIADNAQEKFVEAKTQADEAHQMYVTYLQQMKDYEKMIAGLWRREREDRKRTDAEAEKARVEEVFEKLKSGEKLSTEDLLLLQKSG